MKLSELMRSERIKQGMTLDVASEKVGISKVYLSDIERGKKRPLKKETLEKLAIGFKINPIIVKQAALESVKSDLE
ncbi:MAG: helix-turn-helix transcriptional regulator [Spirochaetaceae bacterium]|jgi:transcriptional regulator with XRE-family HTH domain|nr:helix-turn-helix transcriptional regulator [Spirochaetaceae bacterium]